MSCFSGDTLHPTPSGPQRSGEPPTGGVLHPPQLVLQAIILLCLSFHPPAHLLQPFAMRPLRASDLSQLVLELGDGAILLGNPRFALLESLVQDAYRRFETPNLPNGPQAKGAFPYVCLGRPRGSLLGGCHHSGDQSHREERCGRKAAPRKPGDVNRSAVRPP